MFLKMKYQCLYIYMQKREKEALRRFFMGSKRFGPHAADLVEGFCEARKAREAEFSVDARHLFQRSISISGGFTQYVEDFLVEKPWLAVPDDRDLEKIYRGLTWKQRINLLLA